MKIADIEIFKFKGGLAGTPIYYWFGGGMKEIYIVHPEHTILSSQKAFIKSVIRGGELPNVHSMYVLASLKDLKNLVAEIEKRLTIEAI